MELTWLQNLIETLCKSAKSELYSIGKHRHLRSCRKWRLHFATGNQGCSPGRGIGQTFAALQHFGNATAARNAA